MTAPAMAARQRRDPQGLDPKGNSAVPAGQAPKRTCISHHSLTSKKGAKTRRYMEASLHRNVSELLTLALPQDVFWTTFPSGGGGKIRGAQLKGQGLKAGVPDILLVYFGRAFWLELKTSNGRVSNDQVITHANLIAAHSPVAVCRSLDGVAEALRRWDIPLRARVAA